jgi:hypothetical protein
VERILDYHAQELMKPAIGAEIFQHAEDLLARISE